MKRTLITTIALLLGSVAIAQEPDASYKLLRNEWTVNADGTTDYHHRHEVQILRGRALTAYADKGETFVVYNPNFEAVTINEVYTLRADGSRVDMPQNAFVYQLPSACADCGRFNHIRELAMVHTGMELGCTIVVDYTIHRQTDLLYEAVPLIYDCPIEKLEISVSLPSTQHLNVQYSNPGCLAFSPQVEQSDHSYRLTATDVPQNFVDNYLPASPRLYPTLRLFNDTPNYTPDFSNTPFSNSETDAIGTTGSSIERVTTLRNYIVDNIHLNDIPPALTAYTHSTPEEVWQTGCGTATDKAALLTAILNGRGYQAEVVGDQFDEVSVIIDSVEYRLSLRSKSPISIYGVAHDEIYTSSQKNSHTTPTFDTLADGYYRLAIAPVAGTPNINARLLALTRTAPLQSSACDLQQTDTYTLPKGMKMIGSSISQALQFEGIGSAEISIKQSGRKIKVVRKLKLCEDIVPTSHYAAFRQLITLWQQYDNILLTTK
ncbi:MAG: DUF3857 domain-containing protein [Bacteroidales bacterium]|nr:DUF3857 domain-containing protein [Bacteroidales bacterium]